MGAYNVVAEVPTVCPRCHTRVEIGVQFKYGSTWQLVYTIGGTLQWGGNDIGSPGRALIVAGGTADTDCPCCGYDEDWNFYVFIERDKITRVVQADGTYDFVGPQTTYLDLTDDQPIT